LCSITAEIHKTFENGATTGGRHRVRHTELLCSLFIARPHGSITLLPVLVIQFASAAASGDPVPK